MLGSLSILIYLLVDETNSENIQVQIISRKDFLSWWM
jgi:hypothetical protein